MNYDANLSITQITYEIDKYYFEVCNVCLTKYSQLKAMMNVEFISYFIRQGKGSFKSTFEENFRSDSSRFGALIRKNRESIFTFILYSGANAYKHF